MRSHFLIILFLHISLSSFSQIAFEKGYLINKNGERIDCLIKNSEWKNNPQEFEYKLSNESEILRGNMNSVIEFGVIGIFKYKLFEVEIDRSSDSDNSLSKQKMPEFSKEKLFLKVLIEGTANLYYYEKGLTIRYFYSVPEKEVTQLIFKRYKIDNNTVKTNNFFKQQLILDLNCESISQKDIEYIEYRRKDLMTIFNKYNLCMGESQINYAEEGLNWKLNLNICAGVNYSMLKLYYDGWSIWIDSTKFKNCYSYKLGIESELIFPFNKNKWSVLFEPSYQNYKASDYTHSPGVDVVYHSIELPFSLKYYLFLNNHSKLFLSGSFIYALPIKSYVSYVHNISVEINTAISFAVGFGYKFNDRYSIDFRYGFDRNLLNKYSYFNAHYRVLSIKLGYTFYKN